MIEDCFLSLRTVEKEYVTSGFPYGQKIESSGGTEKQDKTVLIWLCRNCHMYGLISHLGILLGLDLGVFSLVLNVGIRVHVEIVIGLLVVGRLCLALALFIGGGFKFLDLTLHASESHMGSAGFDAKVFSNGRHAHLDENDENNHWMFEIK
jgi:hypothetical protein